MKSVFIINVFSQDFAIAYFQNDARSDPRHCDGMETESATNASIGIWLHSSSMESSISAIVAEFLP